MKQEIKAYVVIIFLVFSIFAIALFTFTQGVRYGAGKCNNYYQEKYVEQCQLPVASPPNPVVNISAWNKINIRID